MRWRCHERGSGLRPVSAGGTVDQRRTTPSAREMPERVASFRLDRRRRQPTLLRQSLATGQWPLSRSKRTASACVKRDVHAYPEAHEF